MLPLTRPALSATIILNGVWMWNDFFLGLILLTREDAHTLPVGIMAFRGTYTTEWGLIFASVCISVAPVVMAFGKKNITTRLPRSSESLTVLPLVAVAVKSGAISPTLSTERLPYR